MARTATGLLPNLLVSHYTRDDHYIFQCDTKCTKERETEAKRSGMC